VNEEPEVGDQQMVGKVGRVTGDIGPGRIGEVMVAVRGGSEAFHAHSAEPDVLIGRGTRVVVVEYFPPRTVMVSPV
jgi:membrane protein implicated in regulation of membrane protease activity